MSKYIDITNDDDIENAFFHGEPACECGACMEPVGDSDTFKCPECGYTCDIRDYALHGPFSYLLSIYYMEPDERGEGCKACGDPSYPKCKTSCSLFDD